MSVVIYEENENGETVPKIKSMFPTIHKPLLDYCRQCDVKFSV
jgi:hypothetical protein